MYHIISGLLAIGLNASSPHPRAPPLAPMLAFETNELFIVKLQVVAGTFFAIRHLALNICRMALE